MCKGCTTHRHMMHQAAAALQPPLKHKMIATHNHKMMCTGAASLVKAQPLPANSVSEHS